MSDVVAIALITGGLGLAASGITAFVSIKTGAQQRRAERDRLHDEHREADRRTRRDAYARLLTAIEQLDMLVSAYTPPPTLDGFREFLADFRAAGVAVRLVESPAVHDARAAFGQVLDGVAVKVMDNVEKNVPMIDALGVPYVQARDEMLRTGRALGNAMADDLAYAADATQP
jgi:hypothetical protein